MNKIIRAAKVMIKMFKPGLTPGKPQFQNHDVNSIQAFDIDLYEVLGNINLITVLLNECGTVTYCNPALLSLTGYSNEKILDSDWFQLMLPDPNPNTKKKFLQSVKNGTHPQRSENPIILKNGELRHIRWNNAVLRNKHGSIIGMVCIGEDITIRKLAEKKEKEYSQNLTNILESISDAFVSLDNNWCYTYMNKKAGDIFNRNPEEMIGKHIWTEFPEGVGQVFYHTYYKAVETQQFQYLEEYYEPYDLWFENRIYPTKDGLSIFFHDITKGKKAEEKLKISEARLKKGQEIGQFGYWQQEIGSDFVWATEEAKKIYGFEPVPGELHKNSIANCINNIELVRQAAVDLIENNKKYDIEFSITPADSSPQKYISAVAELQRDTNGKPTRLIGTLQDITERKRTIEEIKTINDELKTINRVIVSSTRTSDLNVLLDTILEEACQIVGLEGGAICLTEADNTLKLVSHRKNSKEVNTSNSKNKIKIGECLCGDCANTHCLTVLYNHKEVLNRSTRSELQGKQINFQASFPFISKERSLGILCVYTHTNIKPSERSLKLLESLSAQISLAIENAKLLNELEHRVNQRTLQLTQANNELESFSYSISHDLRAPLRAVYGFSQILANRHLDSLNEEGRQFLNYILESSIRMEQLINDLLEYSRLGRKSLVLRPVALKRILDGIYSDFEAQLKEANGRLIIPEKTPQLHSDETLLSQIFNNLIGNAIKYRRTDTPLKITIDFETTTEGDLIKITDNGIGIPHEHCEKIFNVFQRLHNEDEYPGTGIGLANVKKSITMLGGKVYAESKVGTGSTFFIEFPGHKT